MQSQRSELFLDHDQIIDKNGKIYVVIGNQHPAGEVFAYLKYVRGEGKWRGYERVFKKYGAFRLLSLPQDFRYDSCLGTEVPYVKRSCITRHLIPEERAMELINNSGDEVEEDAVSIITELMKLGEIGISGSLLPKIHREFSDIDIVVYGCKSTLKIADELPSSFEDDPLIINEISIDYSINEELARKIYSRIRRGKFGKRRYSITYVDDIPKRYCNKVFYSVGEGEVEVEVEGGECNSLFYPSISNISRVISNIDKKLVQVINFEGIYSYALYRGGRLKVRGLLQRDEEGNHYILIGDKRIGGYVKPI